MLGVRSYRACAHLRIEALERTRAERWKAKHCICLTDARFHTDGEAREAYGIPCPVHGRRVFKRCFIDLSIQVPLHPVDRHFCHCPPMLARQAAEEDRTLTAEEQELANQQHQEWWEKEFRTKVLQNLPECNSV